MRQERRVFADAKIIVRVYYSWEHRMGRT